MEEKGHETTAEHFEIFKAEARRFIELFGLLDWEVSFCHMDTPEEDWKASCAYTADGGKTAALWLSKQYGDEPTPEDLRKSAFHEVCHLLLADDCNAACADDLSPQQRYFAVDRAHHAIIRRLENVVLPRL